MASALEVIVFATSTKKVISSCLEIPLGLFPNVVSVKLRLQLALRKKTLRKSFFSSEPDLLKISKHCPTSTSRFFDIEMLWGCSRENFRSGCSFLSIGAVLVSE